VSKGVRFGSLFAGIGGLDLGFERAGWQCAWQVERDGFCARVLEKHWPGVPRYEDVREVGAKNLERVDLVCGGFPCQPWSTAGERRGTDDDRHLWPEMARIVSELRPRWVVGENVLGLFGPQLDSCAADLESEGYAVWPVVLPACGFDAPHRRERIFIIAGRLINVADADSAGSQGRNSAKLRERPRERSSGESGASEPAAAAIWQPEPGVGRVANGVPRRVDRLRSLGNAVVPQVAEFIGRMLMDCDEEWMRAGTEG
jgi:DNA (cytosine-5)-methyltransferase 1